MPDKKIHNLEEVTLVAVTGVRVDQAQAALRKSMEHLQFAKSMLIASEAPSNIDKLIEYVPIGEMDLKEYSRFILKDLYKYIDTSHVLIIQADGFVLNPERWDPSWLHYDYIGAPWPPMIRFGPYRVELVNRVGNGGFSLRSRRLLEMVSEIDLSTRHFPSASEDVLIGHLLYDYLVERGMRFADVETAARFAIESDSARFGQTLATSFGFHGRKNLARLEAGVDLAPA